jgi:excisionase family DNA binding protein
MRLPVDTSAVNFVSAGAPEPAIEYGTKVQETDDKGLGVNSEALATWLGVEIVFVRRLVAERRIPFLKIGKFVRFDPPEVARWIDDQRVGVSKERSALRGRG